MGVVSKVYPVEGWVEYFKQTQPYAKCQPNHPIDGWWSDEGTALVFGSYSRSDHQSKDDILKRVYKRFLGFEASVSKITR